MAFEGHAELGPSGLLYVITGVNRSNSYKKQMIVLSLLLDFSVLAATLYEKENLLKPPRFQTQVSRGKVLQFQNFSQTQKDRTKGVVKIEVVEDQDILTFSPYGPIKCL